MYSLFLVLGLSTLAVVCVSAAIYLRVRRHLKNAPPHEEFDELKRGPELRNLP
jgi:hypothetical protein